MTHDYMRGVSDSQNFILLSDDSTTEDTYELTGNSKMEEKDNIIVISDSSCSSSPKHEEEHIAPKQRCVKPMPVSTVSERYVRYIYYLFQYVEKKSIKLNKTISCCFRILSICDTDTEDEVNDKSSSDFKKSLRRKRLFSDADSSSTSKFDPEDYVPPKPISKKSMEYSRFVQTQKRLIIKYIFF